MCKKSKWTNQWWDHVANLYETDDTPFSEIESKENDNKTTITKEEIESTIKVIKKTEKHQQKMVLQMNS